MARGAFENVIPFLRKITALVAGLNTRFERDAIRVRACAASVRMSRGAAAELEDRVVAEDLDQRGHVPDVDATRGRRQYTRQRRPFLVEVHAAARVGGDEVFSPEGGHAERRGAIALELAGHGARVAVGARVR